MIKIASANISKLDLSNKGLTKFPLEVIYLKNLRKLDLSGNHIAHIPKEVESMKNLELLDLSNNLIVNFYSKICNLKKLKVLNFNNNKIKTIPIQIGELRALKKFHIANNKIKTLPDTFSNLYNLQELNLSKNEIEDFPIQILKIKTLEYLWLNNLPLKTFPRKEINSKLKFLKAIYCFGSFSNADSIDKTYHSLTKKKGNSIKELSKSDAKITSEKHNPTKEKSSKITKNKIFISYSHKDSSWLSKVQTNLKVLKHNDYDFELWDDTRIKTGDRWKIEIETALKDAGIAILIVSTDFLASDFIRNNELPTLLRNAQENGTRILPLIVRPCLFTKDKYLSEFQSVNSPNSPLSSLSEHQIENELVNLANDVSNLISN